MTDEGERYWTKVLGQAAVSLTGASDAILLKVQLYDTLEEFFDGSSCWKELIEFPGHPRNIGLRRTRSPVVFCGWPTCSTRTAPRSKR